MIGKHPGPSALAVVALALGIGLTATMFSIVQGAILRGLPFEGAEKVQYLDIVTPEDPTDGENVTYHDLVDWRSRQQSFESLEGYNQTGITITGSGGFPERLRGARFTPGVLRALNVSPVIGRDFTEADAEPGAPPVMLIGHTVWESRFQSREDAIGRVLIVNGVATTVIGVMPPAFAFPQTQNAWLPLSFTLRPKRGEGGRVNVIGRLKEGVSPARAQGEMQAISDQLASVYPENKDTRARSGPFVRQSMGGEVVSTLFTMLAAVFGVMIIACVNVTNLQLARAAERTKEVAVRVAIGASRWRIVRQILVEGLVLSTIGAAAGLALAYAGTALFMRAIVDTEPPFWINVYVDPAVLLFSTGITVTAALVSSLVPGWRLAKTDVNGTLKDDSRGTTSLRMGRFTRWLVVVEVTVSCILLVVSGLMIRSIVNASRFTYPFATEDVFFGAMNLDDRSFPKQEDIGRANALVEEQLSRVSGVRSLALATDYPRGGGGTQIEIEGRTYDGPEAYPRTHDIRASVKYFEALRVEPVLGRLFNASDSATGLPVVIVDEGFARRNFPEGPIGRRIRYGRDSENGPVFNTPWLTIVGVVPNLVEARPGVRPDVTYRPLAQVPSRSLFVFASASGDPLTLTTGMRTALAGVGQGIPLNNVNTFAQELWSDGWVQRVFGGLFATFGLAALVLASAGLYGVMAFGVRQRTQEIGVRMAMGADRRRVLLMVLWQGMWRVSLAIVVGLVPGYLVGGLMRELLEGVDPGDPLVLGLTSLTLLLSGVAASLAPALRAASVDPIVALRGDR